MIKNVHGNIVDYLGEAIVAGRFAVGASLPPEAQLRETLGVSRTVLREAVKSLVAKGLVTVGPKVGTRVRTQDHWNWFDADIVIWQTKAGHTLAFLRDLYDLRRTIEPAAVRLAALRATAQDIAELEDAFAGMQQGLKLGGDYVTSDLRFHQGLLRASHNRMMEQMGHALGALLRVSFEVSNSRADGLQSAMGQHRAILDAVIQRHPAKAERAALALIDKASENVEQVFLNLPS